MKQFILIFIFIGFTMMGSFLEIQAQTDSEDIQTEYVLTVGGEGVTLNDFKHIYGKNNRDSIITPELLDEYMDLFIIIRIHYNMTMLIDRKIYVFIYKYMNILIYSYIGRLLHEYINTRIL